MHIVLYYVRQRSLGMSKDQSRDVSVYSELGLNSIVVQRSVEGTCESTCSAVLLIFQRRELKSSYVT